MDLRHLVTLSLGPAMDMSDSVPASNLDRALCPNSLAPTLGLQRREYWEEINPLLVKWNNVNDTRCPECARLIRVNMARHLRLVHSDYVCFWRCPVASCSLWFTSELNAKDHIENIHRFREGRGTSFYECLRTYGRAWFGNRSFFDGRRPANQALWMVWRLRVSPVRNSATTTSSRGARSTPPCAGFSTLPSTIYSWYITHYWSPLSSPSHSLRRCVPRWRTVTTSHQRGAPIATSRHTATLPVGTTSTRPPAEDAVSPVVMTRRITPAKSPVLRGRTPRCIGSTSRAITTIRA